MISNVTKSECGSCGSESTCRQAPSPSKLIAPMPSHFVNDRRTTPRSGTTPKVKKNASAGSTSHDRDPLRPPLEADRLPFTAGGASVLTAR